jgi:hypothetical protein
MDVRCSVPNTVEVRMTVVCVSCVQAQCCLMWFEYEELLRTMFGSDCSQVCFILHVESMLTVV